MSRLIFESSPLYLVLCLALAVGAAYILYKAKHPWSKRTNQILFATRAVLIFLLALLLLEPILKQVNNFFIKPVMVVLQDDSGSVNEVVDSLKQQAISKQLSQLQKQLEDQEYAVTFRTLQDPNGTSDFTSAMKKVSNDYEGQKVAGLIFISDGIYNAGISPLYTTFNFPIHTIGVGDTTKRIDLLIKNTLFNKIAYQGNRFPIRIDISAKGFLSRNIQVSLLNKGKVVDKKEISISNEALTQVEFLPQATEQGLQRYEIVIAPQSEEWNTTNNRTTVFVEVVSGKKKILALAPAPHPDIKALRAVIEKNENYDFDLHIPGTTQNNFDKLSAEADLIILFQVPDLKGITRQLLQKARTTKASLFFVLGEQTHWQELNKEGIVQIEGSIRQFDDVVPAFNPDFSIFNAETNLAGTFQSFPPASVPFVKMKISPSATPLLFQKVGSLVTDKPLLYIDQAEDRKIALMLGEGLWRWRLQEFSRNENTESFDELFGKLIQYLSTTDDRRKFRSYPIKQEFLDTESVQFESQVYNDIFEPVYNKTITIELTNEAGVRTNYQYTTSEGNTRYTIGNLAEGVYRYKASAMLEKKEEVSGEFLVSRQQIETQNLTADFDFLRRLSTQTGGQFVKVENLDALTTSLAQQKATAVIQSEEKYDNLINLKWIFFLLLILISSEWFLRKYHGSY
ncbi:MAG: VWA domain-containing protein [Cytophagia bacterium]|nr:VWA domain-containing protein [Cytophagia bacterium]